MDDLDSGGVTGIVWRRVTPGREAEAEAVMRRLMTISRGAKGFLGSEIFPPIPGLQDAYVVLYRFERATDLRAWLGSPERQACLSEMAGLLLQPAVEFFFAHGRKPAGTASSVFAYRIRPDRDREFRDWRSRILEEARRWPGFLGTESFDAVEGTDPEFIVVVRFDSRDHLDAWLESPIRQAYIDEVRAYVDRFTVRRIGSGFEGWFDISPSAHPPARWRQALVILSALFPVILIMRTLLAPVFAHLPLPLAFLILLAVDMAFLTYVVMPPYTRLMRFWLVVDEARTAKHEAGGLAVIFGILGLTLTVFLAFGSHR